MIVVVAKNVVKSGMAGEFTAACQACIDNTRKEEGNVSYELLASTENEDTLVFIEEWESMESLSAHMKSDHFAALGGAIADMLAAPMDIKVYESERVAL